MLWSMAPNKGFGVSDLLISEGGYIICCPSPNFELTNTKMGQHIIIPYIKKYQLNDYNNDYLILKHKNDNLQRNISRERVSTTSTFLTPPLVTPPLILQ